MLTVGPLVLGCHRCSAQPWSCRVERSEDNEKFGAAGVEVDELYSSAGLRVSGKGEICVRGNRVLPILRRMQQEEEGGIYGPSSTSWRCLAGLQRVCLSCVRSFPRDKHSLAIPSSA